MPQLTDNQQQALRNLARKKLGDAVPFVNIADARVLTELGLARRTREGWEITADGSTFLAGLQDN
ncbi:hypothetical protein [Phenylobacterium deserti]|uniref:Uncharacterized protein n=1 Tax=Phenylobacterium deserti TaxID=1914756 RepID=A0A328AV19_9CAUL|nr:hypothetical protein [Phenylobacterium deserti]RAK57404.1 hypothetical protein DJ018_05545 [Phenylobacterium deserti]